MTSADVHAIGYIAQGLFASRFIIQWISSEKAGKIVAPTLFWHLSLSASFLLIIYSILVKDITILFGQSLAYYIYVRNLSFQNSWKDIPKYLRYVIVGIPLISCIYLLIGDAYNFNILWGAHENSWMLLWGGIGQLIFSSRFIYQWYYSEKLKKSLLPLGFWIISIIGSIIISSYTIYLSLYPIVIGHFFGLIVYSRNVMIYYKSK